MFRMFGCLLSGSAILATTACSPFFEAGDTEEIETSKQALGSVLRFRTYWNASTGDHWTSSASMVLPAGTHVVRDEGSAFSPTEPQPLSTVPLYTWHNAALGDYFTTAAPAWAGVPGDVREGYSFVRKEGYVYTAGVAGTLPLQLWWSPSRGDYYTTTDPRFLADRTATREPDYEFVRTEGYVLEHFDDRLVSRDTFHYDSMIDGAANGERDLLGILVRYWDQPFDPGHDQPFYDDLLFGPGFPNVRDYTITNSKGRFTWRRGATLGPVMYPDDPDTFGDESSWAASRATSTTTIVFTALLPVVSNRYVGSNANARTGLMSNNNIGTFETFNLADLNGGPLLSGDPVAFKTWQGLWLRENGGDLTADATAPTGSARFTIRSAAGGQIVPNTQVTLQASNGRYWGVNAAATSITVTGADTLPAATWFTILKAGPDPHRWVRAAIAQAQSSGYDFSAHDHDGDGRISGTELTVLTIGANPASARRGVNRAVFDHTISGTGLTLAIGDGCMVGEDTSFTTVAHELMHQLLGTIEMYGASGLNQNLTLMGATVFAGDDDRQTFLLDPWTRMALGWHEPRIHAISAEGASVLQWTSESGNSPPILLYDPVHYDIANREGEYFLLEFRNPIPFGYDQDAATPGVAIWQVKTNSSGRPVAIPSMTPPASATDGSINTLGAPPSATRGGSTLWDQTHGAIALRYIDGTSAGVQVKVGAFSPTSQNVFIEWSQTGLLRPRLDNSPATVVRGAPLTVTGMFPVNAPESILTFFNPATGTYTDAVPFISRTGARIDATAPGVLAPGNYRLYVRGIGGFSNGRPIAVTP